MSRTAEKSRAGRAHRAKLASPLPAHLLQSATVALFNDSDDPARDRHRLVDPLSQVVAWHKTRRGQAICAQLAGALAANAYGDALEACRALIALEADCNLAVRESDE